MRRRNADLNKWRPNRGISFNRWQDCDRCGLPWAVKALRKQRGASVCPECYDEPSYEDNKVKGELRSTEGLQSAPWTPDEEGR